MAKSLKILIVDDDCDNGESLAELFELEGHRTRVAYSGEEAISAYLAEDFDVAFMDVMMPGKNGVESFIEIKRMRPNARVYMMTGYSVDQLLRQAMDNGALGVFGKPVNINEVLSTVESMQTQGIVLVAEDDPDFGPTLQMAVESTGRTCELVVDGQAAVSRVRRGGVDVLVLDLNMPLMSGIEVYMTLRKDHRSVPTVMITACGEHHHPSLAALDDIEFTGILNKPFDFNELVGKLDRLSA